MAMAIINGKRVEIPSTTTDAEIREQGEIKPGRTLLRRDEKGNFIVPPGSVVNVSEGDVFVDAPSRIKG